MKTTFRLSTISLAILLTSIQPTYASHAKHHHKAAPKAAPAEIVKADIEIQDPAQASVNRWSPTPLFLPANQEQFLTWVEDLNGGKSREHLMTECWKGMLCVSGLLDLDAVYYDRHGEPFGPTASYAGVGVRPVFGPASSGANGSINNANVFVDLKFPELVRIHANLAYVNGGIKTDSYAGQANADWASVYRANASIKADELFVVFSTPSMNPLYIKIGRMYLDYGDYIPNGYGLPTIVPSLTQLMTQVRTGGAQAGIALNNGLYGSATWSMAQLSMLPFTGWHRNYSAKLGYMHAFTNAYLNINASYLWDLTDADYINGTLYNLNTYVVTSFDDNYTGPFRVRRQHGFAVHADGKYGQFGAGIEAAAATGPLNPYDNSNLWTAGADINYSFSTHGHDSSIDLGYQIARHTRIMYGSGPATPFPLTGFTIGPFANQLPSSRYVATYIFKVIPHVNTALQWVHDRDFGRSSGTGLTSNFGIFRIDLEF